MTSYPEDALLMILQMYLPHAFWRGGECERLLGIKRRYDVFWCATCVGDGGWGVGGGKLCRSRRYFLFYGWDEGAQGICDVSMVEMVRSL